MSISFRQTNSRRYLQAVNIRKRFYIRKYSALTRYTADFTRYAPNPRSQYVQLIIIPIAFTFCAFVGIACTSAGYVHYGEYYWDPLRYALSRKASRCSPLLQPDR